jgi:PAS domain-containing protein
MRWLSTTKMPLQDKDGTIMGTFGVSRDVTERKCAEEARRQANARLELALRGSNVGVWDNEMWDGDYRHGPRHYVNVWEQLGREGPPGGLDNAVDLLHPDDRAHIQEAERRYLAGETAEYEAESRLRHTRTAPIAPSSHGVSRRATPPASRSDGWA